MAKKYVRAEIEVDREFSVPDDGLSLLPDEALLDLVRGGNNDAYALLFERYRHPALRLAAYFSNSVDAKDIVAETFTEVLNQLRRGQGPRTSFRSYLFTSVRREAGKRARLHKRVSVTDDMATIDKPVQFGGGGCDSFERDLVRAAFAALPVRWRTVLWQLDVDGLKPNELAAQLGIKPNAVSALAYRAREGLRKAYLEQHVLTKVRSNHTGCQEIRRRLVAFIRGSASTKDVGLIDPHLEACVPCRDVYLELEEVNTHLGAVSSALSIGLAAQVAPGVLGGAVAKATLVAKSIAALVGTTAAVMATSITVLDVPMESPAAAEPIPALPYSGTPVLEPDRTIGPAADRPDQPPAAATAERQSLSSPEPTPTPTTEQVVSRSGSRTTATVDAAGVQIDASVDLRRPKATAITVERTQADLTPVREAVKGAGEKAKNMVEGDAEQ